MNTVQGDFEWWEPKNIENRRKHGIDFCEAVEVFDDPDVVIIDDFRHSRDETRFYAIGRIPATGRTATVRFTVRERIRIFGAGYWSKQRELYEKENEKR